MRGLVLTIRKAHTARPVIFKYTALHAVDDRVENCSPIVNAGWLMHHACWIGDAHKRIATCACTGVTKFMWEEESQSRD